MITCIVWTTCCVFMCSGDHSSGLLGYGGMCCFGASVVIFIHRDYQTSTISLCNERLFLLDAAYVNLFTELSYSTLSPVSTGMGDHLRADMLCRYVTKPTGSTQPCIHLGMLNRVPPLIGWGKGRNVTSAGWLVTPCDPIRHTSFGSGEACLVTLLYFTLNCMLYLYCHANGCRVKTGFFLSCFLKFWNVTS